ncbi:MAG: hypothetical protein HND52_14965 [Ignavibacteriae bacterium]|nr:hypothetical protein [Ignavibacteriota bacterium]NOG99255.1 hypothetical protein [Ignavibacteriota bacterium]
MIEKIRYKILLCVLALIIARPVIGGDGPTQPEAAQFEPVDMTDVVNLVNGDFVYSIPLMSVPGPEGSYPINLSYHAGIGPNQEATWVGLGWSLNPGSINRMVNGFPDDFNNDFVETHFHAEQSGYGIGLTIGYGPVGLNINFDSNEGFGGNIILSAGGSEGFGASISMGTDGVSLGLGYGHGLGDAFNASLGLSIGTQGVGLNGGVSRHVSYADDGLNTTGLPLVGFSLRSGVGGSNSSISAAGFSSQSSVKSGGDFTSSSFSIPIPLPLGFSLTISWYKWRWYLDELDSEPGFGFIYQMAYMDYEDNDGNTEPESKYEMHEQGGYIFPTQDHYQVNSQGLSGTFKPYFDVPYILGGAFYDPNIKTKGILSFQNDDFNYNPVSNNRHGLNYLFFKFINEVGNNYATWDTYNGQTGWGYQASSINQPTGAEITNYGSKKIKYDFDNDGKLIGFRITTEDGKTYHYYEPIKNYLTYTSSRKITDHNINSYTHIGSDYSTSWLLTSITGPDYVDNGIPGISDDDWGFWTKLNYTDYGHIAYRTPHSGYAPSENSSEMESFSLGSRDYKILESIESKTHRAEFSVYNADDRIIPTDVTAFVLQPWHIYIHASDNFVIRVKGDWRELIESAGDQILLAQFYWYTESGENKTEYIKKIDVEGNPTYDESKQVTDITVKRSSSNPPSSFPNYRDKYFYAGNIFTSDNIVQKNLDKIKLYNKADVTHPIKTVVFNDGVSNSYELCTGAPNSGAIDQAKYTLKNIKFLGENDSDYGLPHYQFSYANNPSWGEHDWDKWGSYRDPGAGSGFREHETPQTYELAKNVAAWSLSRIVTPTGGTIDVQYESDDFYYVNDGIDFQNSIKKTFINPGIYTDEITINDMSSDLTVDKTIYLYERIRETTCDEWCQNCSSEDYHNIFKFKIISVDGNVIKLDREHPFEESDGGNCEGFDYHYEIYFSPHKVFGGGIRVKSITSSDGFNSYKSDYSYVNDDGYSSGVTPTLPAQYKDKYYRIPILGNIANNEDIIKYKKVFLDHELSYGRPSPNVLYSKVEVTNVENDGSSLTGKTVYNFHTAFDEPYEVNPTGTQEHVLVKNKSSIYGLPKKVEYYSQSETGEFSLIKEDVTDYLFSDELKTDKVLKKGITLADYKHPGLILEKYISDNQLSNNGSYQKKYYQLYNYQAYPSVFKSTIFSGIGINDKVSITNINLLWDAYTGEVIASAKEESNNKTILSKITPAYWKYPLMEEKNMLTQSHQETIFSRSEDISQTLPLTWVAATSTGTIISSEVKTWSNDWANEDNLSWRQNETYIYNPDYSGGIDFPSDSLMRTADYYPAPKAGFPWIMTSNISNYDDFSHPIQESHKDGSFTSSLYGYGDALPVAIATNAKSTEIMFSSYEEENQIGWWSEAILFDEARTGKKGIKFSSDRNRSAFYSIGLGTDNFNPNGKFTLSAWKKSNSLGPQVQWKVYYNGTSTYPANKVAEDVSGNWEYIETTVDLSNYPNVTEIVGIIRNHAAGTGHPECFFDDIRIYPTESSMNTYTYDPLTWKLSSITDENNITTFFEYDEGGRLIVVKDNNSNITAKHEYKYNSEQ